MDLSTQVLFFFSGLGAFNGIVLAAYLCLRASRQASDKLLALLLLMIATRVGKSVFFFFSPDLAKVYLQLGLSACFLIGPCLYLYVLCQSRCSSLGSWSKLHLAIPFGLIVLVGIIYPYQNYPNLWGDVIYKVVNYYWLAYLLLSFHAVLPLFKQLITKDTLLTAPEKTTITVYIGTAVIFLAYFSSSYTSYIAGALSFSFVLYLSLLFLSYHVKDKKQLKYRHNKIGSDIAQSVEMKLEELLQEESLFKDPNLTLSTLAKRLGESSHTLSQLLNDNLQTSFADYINQKRIDYAKALLKDGKSRSIEMIAEQSGYNSLSTFYSAFKKFTGQTPARYRDAQ